MSALKEYVNQTVSIITNDGRVLIGNLRGFDVALNVVVEDCAERVFSREAGVDKIDLGLYIVRGDNVAVVSELDEERDGEVAWSTTYADPLKPVVH